MTDVTSSGSAEPRAVSIFADRGRLAVVALGVLGLGPGIGMEQIDHGQRPIGHAGQRLQRIAMDEADIGEPLLLDLRQTLCHAVHIGLGPDQAVIGQHVGAIGEMFAAAEADLEMEGARIAEQSLRRDRAFVRHRDPGQQIVHQPLLMRAQRLADRPAVKPVQRGRVAFLVSSHGARPRPIRRRRSRRRKGSSPSAPRRPGSASVSG